MMIETERLLLREYTPDDIEALYSRMKYTNEGSWRTAMANGMKKVK